MLNALDASQQQQAIRGAQAIDLVLGPAQPMAEIRSNLASTYFAWYRPTTSGSASYYRVQGPTVWIEFAPQSGGGGPPGSTPAPQTGALAGGLNHVHSIYRDPTNEYGVKWTGQ